MTRGERVMDETRMVDPWQRFVNNDRRLPLEWRKGIYRGMVELLKEKDPRLRGLSTKLVMGMMETESTFDPMARSKSGALGLMQVKPETADWIRGKMGEPEGVDLFDPEENVLTGMLYLKYLKDRFKSVSKAVQAYNVGPGGFERGRRNQDYLRKVMSRGLGG